MRKRLQIALMASTMAATSLSLAPGLRAAEGGDGVPEKAAATNITATDEHGRKVYVNEPAPAGSERRAEEPVAPRRSLMYWSSKENRWKPVPPPNAAAMRAARSAAAEVNQYLGHDSSQSASARIVAANFRGSTASPADIDSAIQQAAARHNELPTGRALRDPKGAGPEIPLPLVFRHQQKVSAP